MTSQHWDIQQTPQILLAFRSSDEKTVSKLIEELPKQKQKQKKKKKKGKD